MPEKEIISHLFIDAENNWHIQLNDAHSNGVAELARHFASEFGMGEWGHTLGFLHDRGKERNGFQQKIRIKSKFDISAYPTEDSNHSLIGAIIAHEIKCKGVNLDQTYWLSNPIAGHHRGLYDTDELEKLLLTPIPPEVSTEKPTKGFYQKPNLSEPKQSHHLVRMLYSCLVDADWLDTERFMNQSRFNLRKSSTKLDDLNKPLLSYLNKLTQLPCTNLNKIRAQIQDICVQKSSFAPGFYSLTVPTGGGKTLASMAWAINHAIHHNKKRIIIAIPFTSIIVQTAQILRTIFGDDNVVEHHSVITNPSEDSPSRLACENWDAPIIVTTNVQLLQSIFSNKPSKCRKLHSLCNSIVIFDEPQTIPLPFLQPTIDALKCYAHLFGVSFLFCSATQPLLKGAYVGAGEAKFNGLDDITEIVNPNDYDSTVLKRVDIQFNDSPIDIDSLCQQLEAHSKVLCIVNTRKLAHDIYQKLNSKGIKAYHLSRMMCPAHILDTINQIKQDLAENKSEVRVISTQLIEAGVDIDFPIVFRQLAGLDSILQAAGRCNREGKLPIGHTHVFKLKNDKPHGSIKFATYAMQRLINLRPDADWFAPETINEYRRMLYNNTPSFDKNDICALLNNYKNCCFEEAATKFRLIDDDGISILIPYGKASSLIEVLKQNGPTRELLRQLGRFCVSVRVELFKTLHKTGMVTEITNDLFLLILDSQYDSHIGLKTDNTYLEQTLIF